MEIKTVPASMEYLDEVMAFLDRLLCKEGCPENDRRLIGISVEELFTNIAMYAYGPSGGFVKIEYEVEQENETGGVGEEKVVWIWFSDWGVPYDPFSRQDPNIHLPIEERPIGGLGVYMVKKFMDSVFYEWKDGCNMTRIAKRFQAEKSQEA